MSRQAVQLSCTPKDHEELIRLSKSRSDEIRDIERAKIILLCLEGWRNNAIAKKVGSNVVTVGMWRQRFAKQGLAGLRDAPRLGKPVKYSVEFKRRLLKQLEEKPPKGFAQWDGGLLAKKLNASDDAVWRVLRKEGIQLRRHRSWCVSMDPEFATKSADVIGLYLNPPQNALVLSIDEKPSIQAIERAAGFVKTSSGKIVKGLKSTYKRHGTINLFAALNIATGVVHSKTTATKKRADFQAFMNEIVDTTPDDKEIHVILDNYCTHKKNDEWLTQHPNVRFHFTPTSASWLNQVEIWFGILSRKTLSGATFASTEELTQAIKAFVDVHNEKARPFVWRKREVRGSQLRNTIINLCN